MATIPALGRDLALHVALVCCLLAAPGATAAQTRLARDDAEALTVFHARVWRYADARDRLERHLPPLDARRDGFSQMLTRRYLASTLRKARINKRQGECFAPPAEDLFRGLIAQAIDEVAIEGLVDEDPAQHGSIDLAVNEPLPRSVMRTVPDALLRRLPALPHAVEYRIVGGALILWDAHAEILVDALSGAFTSHERAHNVAAEPE